MSLLTNAIGEYLASDTPGKERAGQRMQEGDNKSIWTQQRRRNGSKGTDGDRDEGNKGQGLT